MREEGLSMAEEVEWFVGIDWASQSHQVCLVDARGECLGERAVAHGGPGIAELCDWLIARQSEDGVAAVTPSRASKPRAPSEGYGWRCHPLTASAALGAVAGDRQVHSDHDEMRELDRPSHRDQQAIRPILSSYPGVDSFAARKAPIVRYVRPI